LAAAVAPAVVTDAAVVAVSVVDVVATVELARVTPV